MKCLLNPTEAISIGITLAYGSRGEPNQWTTAAVTIPTTVILGIKSGYLNATSNRVIRPNYQQPSLFFYHLCKTVPEGDRADLVFG